MMTDQQHDKAARDLLVTQIEQHFTSMGWAVLLTPHRIGLRELSEATLTSLLQQVKGADERLTAVTMITSAISAPRDQDPPDDDNWADSALLKLR